MYSRRARFVIRLDFEIKPLKETKKSANLTKKKTKFMKFGILKI